MFRAFETALALGLMRGQVLRCELATAEAVDPGEPYHGPWVVETAEGDRRELPTPIRAARMWRGYLHLQTQLDAGKRSR